MRMVDLIEKKRDGGILTDDEIRFIIQGFTDGSIPDYQMSAFAMTVFYKGMTDHETAVLTDAMMRSGDTVDLSRFGDKSVDKHSTGGVGDKTTLIVAPIVSSLGGKMAKMSGRGLGHTGGTVDKLESIPGYQTTLSAEAFMQQVEDVGVAVIGQSGNLTPADKKLYALRDVTATIDSLPLITSSSTRASPPCAAIQRFICSKALPELMASSARFVASSMDQPLHRCSMLAASVMHTPVRSGQPWPRRTSTASRTSSALPI